MISKLSKINSRIIFLFFFLVISCSKENEQNKRIIEAIEEQNLFIGATNKMRYNLFSDKILEYEFINPKKILGFYGKIYENLEDIKTYIKEHNNVNKAKELELTIKALKEEISSNNEFEFHLDDSLLIDIKEYISKKNIEPLEKELILLEINVYIRDFLREIGNHLIDCPL